MAIDAAREVRDTTGALITAAGDTVSDLTNGDNWKAVGKAAVDTAKDLILHPVDSSVKVGDTVKDAGRGVIKAAGVAGQCGGCHCFRSGRFCGIRGRHR